MKNKSILLVISGGIAAYKSLELIRLIKKSGGHVRCILTKGGEQFVTPLSVSALCEETVYTDLWSLKDETEMGHIRLSRDADLIVIAPASANIIAQMANGLANDLASTALLANHDTPVLLAPAMNHAMWNNPATQHNINTIKSRGIKTIGPDNGAMACNEEGLGRMSEPQTILEEIKSFFFEKPLNGYKAIVTSGPTYEPIDPVRFIGNRSSGKQGHAIAAALSNAGADVTLITGPVSIPDPSGVHTIHIETAEDLLNTAENALSSNNTCDIAVCAAAVGDWSPEKSDQKLKKGSQDPQIKLTENPDILKTISNHKNRPALVVGFAAETQDLLDNAQSKLKRKSCDWIIANRVGQTDKKVFGEDENHVYLITQTSTQDWKNMRKTEIAEKLVTEITEHFTRPQLKEAAE